MRLALRPLLTLPAAVRGATRTLAAVPALVDAILILPTIAKQLEDVRVSTATLPEMLEEIRRVRGDTAALPAIGDRLAEVERNTLAVQQLAEVALPLQGAALRVGRFADRLPRRAV